MKILITGATGFVGRPLVRRLLAAGHDVICLSRDPARAAKLLPARCRQLAWNPDKGVRPSSFDGVDVVVHLAGEGVADRRWSTARKRAILESRTVGTRALVDEIRALAPAFRPKALISASAIGYYGDRGDEALDERSPAGEGFLADVCVQWEKEAFEAEALGVRVAALRIGIVLGSDGGALAQMLPLFRLGLGGRVGSGAQWMSWIHLTDLVRMFEWAITNQAVRGALNAVAPNPVSNADFTQALAAAVHRPALLPAPAFALQLALGEMAVIVLASQRVAPRAALDGGFAFEFEQLPAALAQICDDDAEVLEQEQWLPQPIDRVFPFFADARNLEKLTPEFLNFEVLGMQPDSMGQDTLIDYRLKLHGMPVRWQSRIADWQPGKSFVDTQTRGPYKLWHHTHEFEPVDGGTLVRDKVRYKLPGGALGGLLGGPFVRRDLAQIFDYRRRQLEELFGQPAGAHAR